MTSRYALALVAGLSVAPAMGASAALPGSAFETIAAQIQQWVVGMAKSLPALDDPKVDVQVGALDPRLKLAPCERIEPYLPAGSRPWGRTRVGLRCVAGPTHWNVYLPVTVHLWASAPVLREPRPAGHVLTEDDFMTGSADWAAESEHPLTETRLVAGRVLSRALAAGEPVRDRSLRQRQWFSAGDMVRVVARGTGYSVSGEGQALTRGLDGQNTRVRTSSGRIVTGVAVAENRVEIGL